MKILIVASKFPPEYSGPGVRMTRLYTAIGKDIGAEKIKVLCNGIEYLDNEDYVHECFNVRRRTAQFIRKNNFPISLFPQRIKDTLAYIAETVITLCALRGYKGQVDMLHIIGHSGGTAAALHWANRNGVPVLMELVTELARPTQKFFVFRQISPPRLKSTIMALTHKAAAHCKEDGFDDKQIWLRPNPVDETIYQRAGQRKLYYRNKLSPFHENDIVISSVAKIMPQKNQILLVKTLKYLPPSFKLIIAGPSVSNGELLQRDKNYIDNIHQLIAESELEDRVHLVFDFVQSQDYMKASDIYAMPAWNEGFGTPMIEAMACGLPVVGNCDEVAFQEWINEGENGFLCPINDPQAWGQAFEKAALFSEEQKNKISAYIHEKAGQQQIYNSYKETIKQLTDEP